MSKSNLQETGYLKLIGQNVALANIGDAAGLQPSAVAGNLFVALYTTDPGETDTGTEIIYTGYSRVAVVRSAVGWTVSGNTMSNAAQITFPINTGSSTTATFFAVRTALSGGDLVGSGPVSPSLTINNGDTPKYEIGDLTITED